MAFLFLAIIPPMLLCRFEPVNKEDEDILIINKIYKKKYTTTHPFRRITRKIAVRAGIEKDVTPYKVIKPSAITNRFEEKVNPRIIQRLAGHKNIQTTLIYDYTSDTDAIKYLQSQENEIDYSKLDSKEKAKIMLDKLFKGEINKTTFDAVLELIKINKPKNDGDFIGYS